MTADSLVFLFAVPLLVKRSSESVESFLYCLHWQTTPDFKSFILWLPMKKLFYFAKIHVVSVSLLNVKNEASGLAATYHIFFTRTPKASRKRDASNLFRLLSQKL